MRHKSWLMSCVPITRAIITRHNVVVLLTILAGILLPPAGTRAAVVTLTASDPDYTSSFNTAGYWSNGQAPSSGNAYFVTGPGLTLRTPWGSANSTFQGASLTINGGAYLALKGASTSLVTINNLTVDNGLIGNWMGGTTVTLAGSITLGSGNVSLGTTDTDEKIIVSASVGGVGSVTKQGSGWVTLSGMNSFLGGTTITGGVLQVAADGMLGAVPSTPQTNITIDDGGLLNNNGGQLNLMRQSKPLPGFRRRVHTTRVGT